MHTKVDRHIAQCAHGVCALQSSIYNIYQVCSHIMHFEWGSEFCDATEADLDDGVDVKLNDSTFIDPGIIVTRMYDA